MRSTQPRTPTDPPPPPSARRRLHLVHQDKPPSGKAPRLSPVPHLLFSVTISKEKLRNWFVFFLFFLALFAIFVQLFSMKSIEHFFELLVRNVGVNLRGCNGRMPE